MKAECHGSRARGGVVVFSRDELPEQRSCLSIFGIGAPIGGKSGTWEAPEAIKSKRHRLRKGNRKSKTLVRAEAQRGFSCGGGDQI